MSPSPDPQAAISSALRALVCRTPPAGCCVIDGSTPVLAFGDYETATVATLGINPSQAEFLATDGALLAGDQRRLATLSSLGAESLAAMTDEQVDELLANCRGYFHRKPFKPWFNQLNHSVKGFGADYYDGSACHLDISMWATDPVWSGVGASQRSTLLEDGEPALRWLLTHGGFDTVIVNGASAWQQLKTMGVASGEVVATTSFGTKFTSVKIMRASLGHTQIVGWSCNVPSAQGMTTAEKVGLGQIVRTLLDED